MWAAARAATFPSRAGRDRADGDVEPSPRRVLPPSHGTESRRVRPLLPLRGGGGSLPRRGEGCEGVGFLYEETSYQTRKIS